MARRGTKVSRSQTPRNSAGLLATMTSTVAAAETMATTEAVTSAMAAATREWWRRRIPGNPEQRWGKESAVERVQRRNLLVARLRGVLRDIGLLPLRRNVAVVVALVPLVHASAHTGIVVPV